MPSDPLSLASIVDLAEELIRIPSVNPTLAPDEAYGESAVAISARDWLSKHGVRTWRRGSAGPPASWSNARGASTDTPPPRPHRRHRRLTMSLAANKALVRQYYETLWNRWEIPLVDQLIADDIEFRGSLGTQVRGRAGFIGYMQSVRAAFPDFHNAIEQMIAEVDTVVARMSYEGTHRGALFGIAPSGRRVRYAGVAIFHIAGSKIARGWVLGDTASLRAQLEPAEHKG